VFEDARNTRVLHPEPAASCEIGKAIGSYAIGWFIPIWSYSRANAIYGLM
jgi:hypothetical protein